MQLVLTPKFKRAYRKFTRHNEPLQKQIDSALQQMQGNVHTPALKTHKLSGNLSGLWACSCGYDCRIVFAIEDDPQTGQPVIVLLDIGTHNEVY